jgi:hypothetical protein
MGLIDQQHFQIDVAEHTEDDDLDRGVEATTLAER